MCLISLSISLWSYMDLLLCDYKKTYLHLIIILYIYIDNLALYYFAIKTFLKTKFKSQLSIKSVHLFIYLFILLIK
jgi:hypothetical protein